MKKLFWIFWVTLGNIWVTFFTSTSGHTAAAPHWVRVAGESGPSISLLISFMASCQATVVKYLTIYYAAITSLIFGYPL